MMNAELDAAWALLIPAMLTVEFFFNVWEYYHAVRDLPS